MIQGSPQLAGILVSALIASEALLLSVFGNLFSAYSSYSIAGGARICVAIRVICCVLSIIIVLVSITAIYAAEVLRPFIQSTLPIWMSYSIHIVVILINVPPLVMTWSMLRDASAK